MHVQRYVHACVQQESDSRSLVGNSAASKKRKFLSWQSQLRVRTSHRPCPCLLLSAAPREKQMADFSEPILAEGAGAANQARSACCHQRRCLVPEASPFDCLAITAPNPRASKAYLDELVHRVGVSGTEGTKEVLILAVSDPEGVRIGSGGGTLNAVLEVGAARKS